MGGGDGADDIVFGFLLYLLDEVSGAFRLF